MLYYMVLESSCQQEIIPLCSKAYFLAIIFPKVVFNTALQQSFPFFNVLEALLLASKINSSGLDYTGIYF